MKLLKSTLFIMALCLIQPVSAKVIKGKQPIESQATPVESPVVAPVTPPAGDGPSAPSKTSFQYLLNRIRNGMASEFIINDQGVFGQKFQEMIKSSGLTPELMEALMQAGRNLHLPLSGKNEQDLATVDYAQDNINRLITQQATPTAPAQADLTPAFYNPKTNLFDQDYLDKFALSPSVMSLSQKEAESKLIGELMPKITNVWRTRNIPISITQVDAARAQIMRTIQTQFTKKWGAAQVKLPEWYNPQTNLITTQRLERFIGDTLRLQKSKSQYEKDLETLEKLVRREWDKKDLTHEQRKPLVILLNEQLQETMNAIEQKRALKKDLINEVNERARKMNPQREDEEIVEEITLPMPVRKPNANNDPNIVPVQKPKALDYLEGRLFNMNFDKDILPNLLKTGDNSYAISTESTEDINFLSELMKDLLAQYPEISDNAIKVTIVRSLRTALEKNGKQLDDPQDSTRNKMQNILILTRADKK